MFKHMPKTKFHPEIRFITDYAAGSLPSSLALCVSSHLHFCEECRKKVEQLNTLGSRIFDDLQPREPSQSFDSLMERIDAMPESMQAQEFPASSVKQKHNNQLPSALQKLTGGDLMSLQWKNIGKNFSYSELDLEDSQRETSLLNIKAGRNVPRHRHLGDEVTVVLKGSFSDKDEHYQTGDFIVRTRGEIHNPVASQDEDCLCLSTLDAPIQMINWAYRLLIPFVRGAARTS
jgi:putative transcriptional regulator